jgi:hypothetical protein
MKTIIDALAALGDAATFVASRFLPAATFIGLIAFYRGIH